MIGMDIVTKLKRTKDSMAASNGSHQPSPGHLPSACGSITEGPLPPSPECSSAGNPALKSAAAPISPPLPTPSSLSKLSLALSKLSLALSTAMIAESLAE